MGIFLSDRFRFSRSDPNLLFSISLSSFCILCKKYITSRFTRRKLIKDKYIYITRQEKINLLTYKYVKKGTFFYKQNTSLIPSTITFLYIEVCPSLQKCTTLVHFALHHPCAFYFAPPLCIADAPPCYIVMYNPVTSYNAPPCYIVM